MIFDADAIRTRHDAAGQCAAGVIVSVRRRVHEMRAVRAEQVIELGHGTLHF
jgi:hypothetical protein